ncbi:MAG: helix-turn-helix transcriptional regulator [Salinisphaeraceae bacterium]|nr:helix-turn-helix transcriptional regulator [Salinisphaeraceae bacterium]
MQKKTAQKPLDTLIDQCYDLACTLDGMTEVTHQIARHTNSSSCTLMLQNAHTYELESGWFWGMDLGWALAYRDRYYQHDPTVVEHFGIPEGKAYASDFHCDNPEFKKSIFFQEWCQPQGLGYFAGAYLMLDESMALRIAIQGTLERGQYQPETLADIQMLMPHLERATRINKSFVDMESRAKAMQSSLDRSGNALILLNRQQEIIHCNEAAMGLMQDGIEQRQSKLLVKDPDARQLLDGAILASFAMLDMSRSEVLQGGFHVSLPRRERTPLTAYVTPVRVTGTPEYGPFQGEMVRIQFVDPEQKFELDARQLEQVLGLTQAEARVAACLCHGDAVPQISDQLGISQFTVRDHIKSIYRKLDVNRQSEFVARAYSALRPGFSTANTS